VPILIQGWFKKIGRILVFISVAGFVLSGLGSLGLPGLNQIWHGLVGTTAIVSLILLEPFSPKSHYLLLLPFW